MPRSPSGDVSPYAPSTTRQAHTAATDHRQCGRLGEGVVGALLRGRRCCALTVRCAAQPVREAQARVRRSHSRQCSAVPCRTQCIGSPQAAVGLSCRLAFRWASCLTKRSSGLLYVRTGYLLTPHVPCRTSAALRALRCVWLNSDRTFGEGRSIVGTRLLAQHDRATEEHDCAHLRPCSVPTMLAVAAQAAAKGSSRSCGTRRGTMASHAH